MPFFGGFLGTVFLFTNVLFGYQIQSSLLPPKPNPPLNTPQLINRHLSIQSVQISGASPSILIVEDVHQNKEAQTRISKAIQTLGNRPGESPLLVAVEGASGAFVYDRFKEVPEKEIAKEVVESFFESGELSGPAHAGMTSFKKEGERGLFFWGVETPELYRQNVSAYLNSVPLKDPALKQLKILKAKNNRVKAGVFNPRLKNLDSLVQRHRSGDLSLGDYVEGLAAAGAHTSLTLDAFLEATAMEKKLNMAKVESQRRRVFQNWFIV